jgi:hypothetical protein
MMMPDAARAFVEEQKVVAYLLNDIHPQGRSKARFFRSFGFIPEQWTELAHALSAHARQGELVSTLVLSDSVQYAIEGILKTPDGREPRIRTVWEVRSDDSPARLITAYPSR